MSAIGDSGFGAGGTGGVIGGYISLEILLLWALVDLYSG